MINIDLISANINIVALIEIFGLFIGIWVYLDNPKNRINQFFSLMTFFVLLWVIFGYLSHSQLYNLSNLILYRLNLAIQAVPNLTSINPKKSKYQQKNSLHI